MHWNCPSNQTPRKGKHSLEHDQKLIRLVEAHNKTAYHIRVKYDQRFVCKCAKMAQPIRGPEIVGIQWSVTHNGLPHLILNSIRSTLCQQMHKSDVKRWNTLGYLDHHICREWGLWNSRDWNSLGIQVSAEDGDHETVRPVKQSRYSWLSGGYVVVMCFLWWRNRKVKLFKLNLTLKVKVNCLTEH